MNRTLSESIFALALFAVSAAAQSHWQDADLTALTKGANATGTAIATGFDPIWNTPRTHYIAADQHVHELYLWSARWQDADLTAITGGVKAAGTAIAMARDPKWKVWRTHYAGIDHHIHELYLTGERWQDADLTALAGGPGTLGNGIAMAFDPVWNSVRTHYVAADRHVHELALAGSRWQDADLTALTGGPPATGAVAMTFDPVWNTTRTHYVASDRHIHELYLTGTRWQDADLTALAAGALAAYGGTLAMAFDPAWNSTRTHYTTGDLHIHELYLNGRRWQDADLTALTNGPKAYGSHVAMAYDPIWRTTRTHYVAADRHVHELALANQRWQDADLTTLTHGAVAPYGNGVAMAFDPVWNGIRTHYVAATQHVHELFLVPANNPPGGNPIPAWAQQAIDAKAANLGLGAAIAGMRAIDSFDYVQPFPNGFDVYWSPSDGAHEVHGEIKRKYDMWMGGAGFLGMPATDETGTPDGVGRYNHFDHGSIYWTPHTGPMTVSGPIRDKWASLGWERGKLGYPVTDQVRWRTQDPATDQFIAWNLFENGAIVTTRNVTDVAGVAHIAPAQVAYLVHRAVDIAVHKLPINVGLYPDVQIINVSNWEYDFIASKSRAVTFKLHGFHDNGFLGDTEFHFWFTLRFSLSDDPASLTDPWYRSLRADLIPGSVGIDVDGISGWFVNGDDYKQKIEAGFQQRADIQAFPVTTYDPATHTPHDQVKLVILGLVTTASGGIDVLVSPEPPYPGTNGSYVPLVQQKIDDFIANF